MKGFRLKKIKAFFISILVNLILLFLAVKTSELVAKKAPVEKEIKKSIFYSIPKEKEILEEEDLKEDFSLSEKQTSLDIDVPLTSDLSIGLDLNINSGPKITFDRKVFSDKAGLELAYKIAAVDRPPKLISKTKIHYPRQAKRQEIEGFVNLKLKISKHGKVEKVWVINSEPEGIFEESAKEALKNFRFSPAKIKGKAVAVYATEKIIFNLR